MSPSSAIVAGSLLIAAAIVASAALFLPDRAPAPPVAQAPAAAGAPDARSGVAPRYQLQKVEDGASWRLDTQTGELTYCRVDGDRMTCTSSTHAVEAPKPTPDELKAERERAEAERKERSERGKAMFDRFIEFFERMLKMVERGMGKSAEPQPGDPRSL